MSLESGRDALIWAFTRRFLFMFEQLLSGGQHDISEVLLA